MIIVVYPFISQPYCVQSGGVNANGITVMVDQYSSYSDSGDSVSHGIYGSNLSLDSINSVVSASQLSLSYNEAAAITDSTKLSRKKSNSLTPSHRMRLSKYHRHRASSESGSIKIDGSPLKTINSTGNLQATNETKENSMDKKVKSSEDLHLESMHVQRSLSGKPVNKVV